MEDSQDVKMEDLQESGEIQPSEPQESEVAEAPIVTSSNGRRRGRRKVMKKKTTKDEEGYLGMHLLRVQPYTR
jgi:DNA polymerase delta subunit 3